MIHFDITKVPFPILEQLLAATRDQIRHYEQDEIRIVAEMQRRDQTALDV